MNSKIFVISLVVIFLVSNKVYAGECEQDCQKEKIEQYFTYLAKVYQEDSSEKDLDRLFELFHQHVTYEHLEYEADFDRNEWMTAFKNNQQRGAYSASQRDRIRVENYILGNATLQLNIVMERLRIMENGSQRGIKNFLPYLVLRKIK